MKPKFIITHALLCLGTLSAASGAIISWNYDRFGTISPTDSAGVVSTVNWNNSWPSDPVTDLADNSGSSTTLDISYNSYGSWSIQGSTPALDGDGTANKRLLNGYLNAGPAEWNPPITYSSVSLSQIPYAEYSVIVYFSADVGGREGQVSLGSDTYYFSTVGSDSVSGSNALFTQTTSTSNSDYATANYVVFSNLSGSAQTVTVQMRDNDEWAGIAGFQVVEVPEPSAAGLTLLGAGAFLKRRRRSA